MKVPNRYFELKKIAIKAIVAMTESMPDLYDDEFGYVMGRIQLDIAHTIARLLPLPKEDDEDE